MSNEVINTVIVNALLPGIVAGVIGTLIMDLFNFLFARFGIIIKIDNRMIGRMSAGWLRGRFVYKNPTEMKQVTYEKILGFISHYWIGISLSIPYVLGWFLFFNETASAIWAIPYGILTTVASWFFVYPSMGLGVFGLKSHDGIKATLSSLSNHIFYGIGIAVGIVLLLKI